MFNLTSVAKGVLVRSPFARYVFPTYPYNFTPSQLCFLCQCLEETRGLAGNALEVGCWKGATSIFLVKYLQAQGIERPYYAIDTFAGFTADDIDYEATARGKDRRLFNYFSANSQAWFDATMRRNGVPEIKSITADVNRFDLRTLGPVAFCLLDVDLFRPILKSLRELYEALAPGGVIIVDDCDPNNVRWDGSDEAYRTFMTERREAPLVVHGKLGVVRKPAQAPAR